MLSRGIILMAVGWLLLFLQVIHILPISLVISFLGHALSFVGLVIGLIGIVHRQTFRPKRY